MSCIRRIFARPIFFNRNFFSSFPRFIFEFADGKIAFDVRDFSGHFGLDNGIANVNQQKKLTKIK